MYKTLKIPVLLSLILVMIGACKKEPLIEPENTVPSFAINNHSFYSGGGDFRSEGDSLPTILGQKRNNPYDVSVMTQAWNNLNATPITEIETTDRYIKFCPADFEQAAALAELDLNLYDYPLEYEILQMGDYWEDPALPADGIPCFYAVVKPDFISPEIPFEVISNLHLEPVETELTEEAFRITGNTFVGLLSSECDEDHPRWPECLCDIYPPGPEREECLERVNGGGDPPGGNQSCVLNNHPRNPAGYIRVEDTQLGLQPVKRVKVILKNGWFTEDQTWTDDNGCFFINRRYRGTARMWVKFKNSEAKIHSLRQWKVWEYFFAVKDYVGRISGPVFNNISVTYGNSTVDISQAKRYWMAATVNNAIQEYHDYAANDNILVPADNLRVVISTWGDDGVGSAPMLRQGLDQSLLYGLVEYVLFGAYPNMTLLMELVQQNAPDITYGYGGTEPSDGVKVVMYHELAHASHFALVGNAYWHKIRYHIVANAIAGNGVYGSPGNFAAGSAPGRVAITESWSEFTGMSYAHRQYGTNNSVPLNWQALLEERIATSGFIPDGLHYDLIDHRMDTNGITDNVSGFTSQQIFSSISSEVHTLGQFQDKLVNEYLNSTTNTLQQIEDLFDDYDFL